MATLKDVAQKAQVSMITVSRVINSPEMVKETTRKRVQKIMASMQYVPNVAAKNLVSKRTGVIDVYVPENIDLSNPFVMHFIAGISNVLSEHMYSFLLLRNRKKENFCDGYIVTGLLRNEIQEFYEYASERSRPVVLFGHTELQNVDCIDVDNIAGAKMATQHLIENGHKNIAMIDVAENKDYTADRLEGYRLAMQEHGLNVDEKCILYVENNVDGGRCAAKELLEKRKISAIFCATDTIAIGASKAVAEAGLQIPNDISLVGFDGFGHQLLSAPSITTVQQPIFRMGEMLAKALIEKLEGKKEKISLLIEPSLLVGGSVANLNK